MSNEESKKKAESVEKAMRAFIGGKSDTKDLSESPVLSFPEENLKVGTGELKKEEPEIEIDPDDPVYIKMPVEEPETVSKKETTSTPPKKSFPPEKLRENLKPELKESLKKLEKIIPKEAVNKLLSDMESKKDLIFNKEVTNVFQNLSDGDIAVLTKKMAEWNIPKEASEINASVIIAWINKTKK